MLLFICLFFCLCVFADYRELSKEEAYAFRSLYGTDDMATLIAIEKDPQKFWREREAALMKKGATLSHLEFCEKLVQEAQKCLLERLPSLEGGKRFSEIDDMIEGLLPKISPLWPNIRARYYAFLCDEVHKSRSEAVFASQETLAGKVQSTIDHSLKMTGPYNAKVCWKISKDGQFSVLDYLILRSKGYYLCGAPTNVQDWFGFSVHAGALEGWEGLLMHDSYSHSLQAYTVDYSLRKFRISGQAYFNQCCNPEEFVSDDLIAVSQKIQGVFYQFHELPSINFSFETSHVNSLIFPKSVQLTDSGFLDITPYFMNVPLGYDWHENPLRGPSQDLSRSTVHKALLGWRAQYCFFGLELQPPTCVLSGFQDFYNALSALPKCDYERGAHTLEQLLFILYREEMGSRTPVVRARAYVRTYSWVSNTSLNFIEFRQCVDQDVQEILRQLRLIEGREKLFLYAPFSVLLVLRMLHASELDEILGERKIVCYGSDDEVFISGYACKVYFRRDSSASGFALPSEGRC